MKEQDETDEVAEQFTTKSQLYVVVITSNS